MPLHPEAVAFLEQLARQKTPSMEKLPLDVTRRALAIGAVPGPNPPALARVENRTIPGPDGTQLPVRLYVPQGQAPFGVCLYFHGGGWILNSIDTHDDLVRRLAAASGCVFINVEYRLAPEHKYPAAANDAYTAVNWVHEHATEFGCDPQRIAVAGDSAGGNLAAAACLMSRDRKGPPIAFQALIYPIVDCDFDRPSYRTNGQGYFLTRDEMIWFWNHYVASPQQMSEPYASPLRATSLQGLPPALVITAGFDPLCDEGEAYAHALRAAGVPCELTCYEGMIHAFIRRVQQFNTAITAIDEVARHLRAAIGSGHS